MADEETEAEQVSEALDAGLLPAQRGIGSPGGPPVVRGTRSQIQRAIAAGKLDELLTYSSQGVTGQSGKGKTSTVLTTGLTAEQEKQLLADESEAKKQTKPKKK